MCELILSQRFEKASALLPHAMKYQHPAMLHQLGQSVVALKLGGHAKHPAVSRWEHVIPNNSVDYSSSYHHVDISKMLTALAIPHQNEAKIEFGIVVDILIEKKKGSKGIVIEVDGPMHYESYLNAPLGMIIYTVYILCSPSKSYNILGRTYDIEATTSSAARV